MGRIHREKERHAQAFEFYYALGADRDLSQVAARFHVSPQAVGAWSRAFDWSKRLSERERIVRDLTAQKAIEDEAQSRADALKICRAIQIRFAQNLHNQTAIVTARDFSEAVKLEQLLRGKATDRTEITTGPAFDKLIDLLSAVIEREVVDPAIRSKLAAGFAEAAAQVGHA